MSWNHAFLGNPLGGGPFASNPRRRARSYSGWFVEDENFVLGYNRRGHQVLLKRTKKGIPSGAAQFGTENEAQRELEFLHRQGRFPLFTPGALPVLIFSRHIHRRRTEEHLALCRFAPSPRGRSSRRRLLRATRALMRGGLNDLPPGHRGGVNKSN